jgi:hypothetical protein
MMTANEESQLDSATTETIDTEPPPEGWVQIPCVRGIFEITPLLDLLDIYGGRIIGGYPRWCCSTAQRPVPAGDCDLFPVGATQEDSKRIYEALRTELTRAGLAVSHENNVSVTFNAEGKPPYDRCPVIQLIKPIRKGAIVTDGTLEEILANFDFTVVRVALNADRKTATAWASFEKDEQRKILRILNIHCPISSMLRVMKYGRKQYYMRPAEALKLFVDWEGRDDTYRQRMIDLFSASKMGHMSKKEIDELEALLRVD